MPKKITAHVHHTQMTTHYDITVAEFLEFEFCFEVATYLGVEPKDLATFKMLHPEKTKEAARYVLTHICTRWCRTHMLDRSDTERVRRQHSE